MGDDIKLKKGTSDMDIIYADNSGLYFVESKSAMRTLFVIGAAYGTDQKLMKFDKNYNEIFTHDYKKELKGLNYHSFQLMGNEVYLFATDYIKKEKLFKVYGVRIDKNSGDLQGGFIELGSYALENKRDYYEMRLKKIRNGNNFLMVSNISGKEHVSLGVSILDKSLKIEENTVIDIPIIEKEFSLQDVQYTADKKIIVLGKQLEETQVGKKKRKKLVFKQYVMMVYNDKGKKENNISMNSGDRFIIGGQLVEQNDGNMMLAGFYSNTSKKEDLSGFFINRVDPKTGQLTLASFKEINADMLGRSFTDEQDEDDDTKEAKKVKEKASKEDDVDEFPNEFIIRSVDINPADNSIIITSEVSLYKHYSYTTSSYTGGSWSTTRTDVDEFTNKDILVIYGDASGNIRWLNAIPKSQKEQINSGRGGNGFYFDGSTKNFFSDGGGAPYYSSYISLLTNNNLLILLNDHSSNNLNAQYGDKVKTTFNFKKKSNLYGITIDLATGKMTRKFILENDKETVLMPRHGYVYENEVVIPSWRMRTLGKTDLKFGRVTMK